VHHDPRSWTPWPRAFIPAAENNSRAIGWREIALLIAAARIIYGVVSIAAFTNRIRPLVNDDPTHISGFLAPLLLPWNQWDAGWYIGLAQRGYQGTALGTAFQPLYPLLIHVLTPLCGGAPLVAALLISTLCFAIAAWLFVRLVTLRFGSAVATQGLLLLAIAPDAFFFFTAYSESLFLALTLATFMCLERRLWLLAGGFAALACLTRLPGLALLPALLGATLMAPSWSARVRIGAAVLIPPILAVAAYQALLVYVWRLPSSSQAEQQGWVQFQPPWVIIAQYWSFLQCGRCYYVYAYTTDCLLAFLSAALLIVGVWRLPLTWTLYGLASWTIALTHLRSTSRFMLVIFPLYVVLALLVQKRSLVRLLVVTVSAASLAFLSYEFFVGWFIA